jgi:hypothetical protein
LKEMFGPFLLTSERPSYYLTWNNNCMVENDMAYLICHFIVHAE